MTSLSKRLSKLEAGRAAKGVSLPLLVYSITDKKGSSCGDFYVAEGIKFGTYRNATEQELLRFSAATGPK